MAIPSSKKELQDAISVHFSKLYQELISIPEEQAYQKELEGHAQNTTMSVHNQVAYLIGWGQLVLKWNRLYDKGQEVDFPETGYKWNNLGLLAQKFYEDYATESYPALLSKLDKTVNELLQLIDHKTNAQLYETGWYNQWTLGRMIQFNTSSPYQNALKRIRKWKKQYPY
jgi:hypothetical protein